jgi:membrane-bound lytic murein transglycosylase D
MRTTSPVFRLIIFTASVLCLFASAAGAGFDLSETEDLFPYREFKNEISFWEKVFTVYESNQVLMHDDRDLRLIYYVKEFDAGPGSDEKEARRQKKVLDGEITSLKRDLEMIHRLGPDSGQLNSRQKEVASRIKALGYGFDASTIYQLKLRLRYQRGIRDKIRESLIRSGRYLDIMKEIFRSNGLPEDLAYLPHVESSFDYNAYSSAGAAGVWQFTRGTGRSYLRISGSVDERLDPIKATEAAARLLRENYEVLGTWAMTMTSYNYGRNGMLRAKQLYGTDFRKIVDSHSSRYFGFASRNFYAEFLTAMKVAKNYQDYFDELPIEQPLSFETIRLTRSYDAGYFTSVPGINLELLADYNPHIMRVLKRSMKIIPAGVEVRVPLDTRAAVLASLESAGPSSAKLIEASDGSLRYKVQPGDSLSLIASAMETPVSYLQKLNGIRNPNRIYPGQLLLVAPPDGDRTGVTAAAADASPEVYVVRRGDNLTMIARKFRVSLENLKLHNGITKSDVIHPGMKLKIPAS